MHAQADEQSNPASPFADQGAPAGIVAQQGHPPVPVSPQHGNTSQPHITSTTPLGGRNSLHCDIACVIVCLLFTLGMGTPVVQGTGIGAAGATPGSPGGLDFFMSMTDQKETRCIGLTSVNLIAIVCHCTAL